jgi:hypothetical protein
MMRVVRRRRLSGQRGPAVDLSHPRVSVSTVRSQCDHLLVKIGIIACERQARREEPHTETTPLLSARQTEVFEAGHWSVEQAGEIAANEPAKIWQIGSVLSSC